MNSETQAACDAHLEDGGDMGVDAAQVQGLMAGRLLQAGHQLGEASRTRSGLQVQQPRLGCLQLQRRSSLGTSALQHRERRANLRKHNRLLTEALSR